MRNRTLTLLALLVALALALTACGGDATDEAAPADEATSAAPASEGSCDFSAPDEPAPGTAYDEPADMGIDPDNPPTAIMETSCGTMRIDLLAASAPATVNSFVFLSEEGWYDGIRFHRVVPGFVIQAGDAQCSDRANAMCGAGDAGYRFDDELSGTEKYKPGTVAMANSGPNTNGSQFFIVTGPEAGSLPPNYTVFGELADPESLEVAQTIEALPAPGESPTDDIWIRSVSIEG